VGLLAPGSGDRDRPEFRIPAGAADHVEMLQFTWPVGFPDGARIWLAATHMHYIGTGMQMHLRRAAPAQGEPEQECLIDTPAWNFDWQQAYTYDAPMEELPTIRVGDSVLMRCSYDNTTNNPGVREALRERGLEAPIDVELGEGSPRGSPSPAKPTAPNE
jgi:hypothetical protein